MTTSHFSSTVATSSLFPSFFPLSLPSAKRIVRVNVRPSKKSTLTKRSIRGKEEISAISVPVGIFSRDVIGRMATKRSAQVARGNDRGDA